MAARLALLSFVHTARIYEFTPAGLYPRCEIFPAGPHGSICDECHADRITSMSDPDEPIDLEALSPGVCYGCRLPHDRCICDEPGADDLFAEHIDQLNTEHIVACAAAPIPYHPLGSLFCRTCGNELANCACFDGEDLPF